MHVAVGEIRWTRLQGQISLGASIRAWDRSNLLCDPGECFAHIFLIVLHRFSCYSWRFLSLTLVKCTWQLERSVELTTRGASNRGSWQGYECFRSKLWTWRDVSRTFFRLFATFLTRVLSHFWVLPCSNACGSWGDPLKSLAGTNKIGGLIEGVGLLKSTVWPGGMFRAHSF